VSLVESRACVSWLDGVRPVGGLWWLDGFEVGHLRNGGAGTRLLIDQLLAGARPPGYGNQPRSHNAVAAAIAQARADWGVAIAPVARLYGLGFLPLSPESYDFLLVESSRDRPAVQAFLAALKDDNVRARIRALGMQPHDGAAQ